MNRYTFDDISCAFDDEDLETREFVKASDVVDMESDAQTLRGYIKTHGETPAMTWSNREHWKKRSERAEADVEKLKMDAEHLQHERDEAREKLAAAVGMAEERLAKNEEAARKIAEVESERDEASESCDNWLIQAQELRKQRDLAVQGRADFRIAFREQKARAEKDEADVDKLKMDAEHLQYERDEAREGAKAEAGEPVAWMRYLQGDIFQCDKDRPDAFPVYRSPPAIARTALRKPQGNTP